MLRKENKMKKFVFYSLLVVFLSGCAFIHPAVVEYQTSIDILLDGTKQKKLEIDNRIKEVEQAYEKGSISKFEYLSLKNSLKNEFSNYMANVRHNMEFLDQKARYQINSYYDKGGRK